MKKTGAKLGKRLTKSKEFPKKLAKKKSNNFAFLEDVKKDLKPNTEVYSDVNEMLGKINLTIKKLKIKAIAVTGGSIAKGNYINYDHDIDLFVKFDKKYDSTKLSDYLKKIVDKLNLKGNKAERIHGSRDYFRIKGRYNFEIVPVLDIKKWDESKNVTDMSPLHVKWVLGITKKNPKLNDEIRLTKQFCKAQNVYGAESYIKGFSGHVIDIITIYHKSFLGLIKSASKWKKGEVIDYHNAHKGKALFNLNKSKIGPLNVIDPIMPDRNASAAISEERFLKFIEVCNKFLKKPSKDFFVKKEVSSETLKVENKNKKVICFKVNLAKGKEDIIGAKLVRALEYLKMKAQKEGFDIINTAWSWDRKLDAKIFFVLEKDNLPTIEILQGPPIKAIEHVARFKKTHKQTYIKSGKLFAKEKRPYPKFTQFILMQSKEDFFKDKFESIKIDN